MISGGFLDSDLMRFGFGSRICRIMVVGVKWVDAGFFKTSGHFSIGKRHILSLNPFSHRVKWTIGAKGCVYIYPKQGDVWALYSNWSPSWGISTPQEVVNKFDMVEVVRDFDEARGVTVVPLVKVPGFQQVFRRQPSPRTFPKQELFRFSHQVASHLLTGQGGKNDPQGYMELDPAAMPPHKVFTVGEMRKLGWKSMQEVVENVKTVAMKKKKSLS